jgi:mannan endo-1,4-beta-mannosidase
MADFLKGEVPSQLVAAGTEGYFYSERTAFNPGAGAKCEGEDW